MLCDDLRVALMATANMRRADAVQIQALMSSNEEARDVLRFWISETANGVRKASGLFSRAI